MLSVAEKQKQAQQQLQAQQAPQFQAQTVQVAAQPGTTWTTATITINNSQELYSAQAQSAQWLPSSAVVSTTVPKATVKKGELLLIDCSSFPQTLFDQQPLQKVPTLLEAVAPTKQAAEALQSRQRSGSRIKRLNSKRNSRKWRRRCRRINSRCRI